ncbi:unnamed protein product, partial [Prorocentrum cordatum]
AMARGACAVPRASSTTRARSRAPRASWAGRARGRPRATPSAAGGATCGAPRARPTPEAARDVPAP